MKDKMFVDQTTNIGTESSYFYRVDCNVDGTTISYCEYENEYNDGPRIPKILDSVNLSSTDDVIILTKVLEVVKSYRA